MQYYITHITFTYFCDWYLFISKTLKKLSLPISKLIIYTAEERIEFIHLILAKSNRDHMIIFASWSVLIFTKAKNVFYIFIETLPYHILFNLLTCLELLVKSTRLGKTMPLIAPYSLKLLLLLLVYHIINPPNAIYYIRLQIYMISFCSALSYSK